MQSLATVVERLRKLEDAFQQERAAREAALAEERRVREREVRILREALHPFYRSEEDMRRKLIEIEDRLEGSYDEQLRLKDRVMALDDANMALEKRLEEAEGARTKRKRVSRQVVNGFSPDSKLDEHERNSSHSSPQTHSLPPPGSSRAISPTGPISVSSEHEEPRSSGILNLVEFPEPTRSSISCVPREPSPREEVRSSGFLEISLAERLASKFSASALRDSVAVSEAAQAHSLHHHFHSRHSSINSTQGLISTQIAAAAKKAAESTEGSPTDGAPKKRKWDSELKPLDILANLSAASPMV